jgi:hypothetical protein
MTLDENTSGWYRLGEEEQFPWGLTTAVVWYALLLPTLDGPGLVIKRVGYKSTTFQKEKLAKDILLEENKNALLLGVWNGQYSTHLFVLDKNIAALKLQEVVERERAGRKNGY